MDLTRALAVAEDAARAAGDLLRADFHRPGGAARRRRQGRGRHRGRAAHPRRVLTTTAFPDWGYLGEETGAQAGRARARRSGSSIPTTARATTWSAGGEARSPSALVAEGRPVLGVVFAFGYPDDRGTFVAWAEGAGPLRRDGVRRDGRRCPRALGPHGRRARLQQGRPRSRGQPAPAPRPRASGRVPSIAHRLALVAAGEAAATSSLFSPRSWDYGGGHALLRGGGRRARRRGRPRGDLRRGRATAASRARVRRAPGRWRRRWRAARGKTWAPAPWTEPRPAHLERGRAIADAALLSRAQGCLLGQVAGDSLGALVEFESAARPRAGRATGRARWWTADAGTCSPASPPTTPRWRWRWRARSWPGAGTSRGARARRLSRVAGLGAVRRRRHHARRAHRLTARGQPGQRLAHAREPAGRPRPCAGRRTRPSAWRGRTARSRTPPRVRRRRGRVRGGDRARDPRRRGARGRVRARARLGAARAPTPRWWTRSTMAASRRPGVRRRADRAGCSSPCRTPSTSCCTRQSVEDGVVRDGPRAAATPTPTRRSRARCSAPCTAATPSPRSGARWC